MRAFFAALVVALAATAAAQPYPPTPVYGGTLIDGLTPQGNIVPFPINPNGTPVTPQSTNPGPTYTARVPHFDSAGAMSYSAAVGPLVGDGGLAIVTANFTGTTISCWGVNPGGTLRPVVKTTVTGNPRMLALGDFNEDGLADVAVTNRTTTVQVLYGDGGCGFGGTNTALFVDGGVQPQSIQAAKLAAQTHVSIVVGDRASSLFTEFIGYGDGGFAPAIGYTGCSDINQIANPRLPNAVPWDFNADGFADFAFGCATANPTQVGIMFGTADGGFFPYNTTLSGEVTASSIAVGDLNNDGVPDLVIPGSPSVLLGASKLAGASAANGYALQPAISYQYAAGHNYTYLGFAVADFNGDGFNDVAVAAAAVNGTSALTPFNGIQVLTGNGLGQLSLNPLLDLTAGIVSSTEIPVTYPGFPVVTDLNGDGYPDIVVANFGNLSAAVGVPSFWTILSSAPTTIAPALGAAWQITPFPGSPIGASPGPAAYSTVNCVSSYATYLGTLPARRSIAVQTQYDNTPIWVGGYNVCAQPGYGYSSSDAGFVDAGACQVGEQLQPGGYLSKDIQINNNIGGTLAPNSTGVNGLYCIKASGAQDGTPDGGWTVITELP